MAGDEFPRAALTADVTLFRYVDGRLEILLIQRGHDPYKGRWALPGGFVDAEENPEAGARRELEEETGVVASWLMPIGGFGDVGRDPRGRTVTLTYLTVLDDAAPIAGDDADDTRWADPRDPPPLAFDHDQMVATALERLGAAVSDPRWLPRLLPARASWTEIHRRLCAFTGQPLEEAALRARVDALGLLRPAGDGLLELDPGALRALPARRLPF